MISDDSFAWLDGIDFTFTFIGRDSIHIRLNVFLATTVVHKIKRGLAGGLEFKGVGAK